jgi:hypothetical protein
MSASRKRMPVAHQTTLRTTNSDEYTPREENKIRAEPTKIRTWKHTRRDAENSAKRTYKTEREDGHIDERPLHRVQQHVQRLEARCEFIDRGGEEQHGNFAQHGVENLNDDLGFEEPKQHAKVDLRDNITNITTESDWPSESYQTIYSNRMRARRTHIGERRLIGRRGVLQLHVMQRGSHVHDRPAERQWRG